MKIIAFPGRRIRLLFVVFCAVASLNHSTLAQRLQQPADILFTLDPALPPVLVDQAATFTAQLAGRMGESVNITVETGGQSSSRDYVLQVTVRPCEQDSCAERWGFSVTAPVNSTLFTPSLQSQVLNENALEIRLLSSAPPHATDDLLSALSEGLYHYASGTPDRAIPLLDRATKQLNYDEQGNALLRLDGTQSIEAQHAYLLDFYRARSLHDVRNYADALALLLARRPVLQADAPLRAIWDAAIADALAQNFEFNRAIIWDDRNIMTLRVQPDMAESQLLAELYLLRGQHRLYLYEWDVVMDDYNAAIALKSAPPRAYYLRGLLNYTQNSRQAAYDDLIQYLMTETDPESSFISLAEAYLAELEALLTTPQAQ